MQRGLRGLIAAIVLTLGTPGAAGAATFIVNDNGNTSDSSVGNGVCRTSDGVCTLRAAIQEANATIALDTIAFAIGSGSQRITVGSSLPDITRPVVVDGWSQPGFAGAPLIEIHGSNDVVDGLRITGGGSTIRGLVVNGFTDDGIHITGAGGNVIEGCFLGTNADGSAPLPNQATGIRIETANNRVGGLGIAQRNVVSGNTGRSTMGGIYVYGTAATGNVIQGNFIGLDATGVYPMGNEGRGVAIHNASNNVVGGSQPGAGNLIAANRATGVRVWGGTAKRNLVQGNWIGVNKLGEIRVGLWPEAGILSNARGVQTRGDENYVISNVIMGNTWDGVIFYDGTEKDLDPTSYPSNNVIYDNTIAYNGLNGIGMYDGHRNLLMSNRIYDNDFMAIELGNFDLDSVTPNDAGDVDSGPNDWQNYPVLTKVTATNNQTTLAGTLNSKPSQSFLIQVFANNYCDPVWGHGEARYYLGDASVTTNASGIGSFMVSFPYRIPAGMSLSATAIDADWNTSEVSGCLQVQ